MTTTTKTVRSARANAKAAAKATAPKAAPSQKVDAPTKREMATAEVRLAHQGTAASTYRIGKNLTPLRTDYRAGQMSEKDNDFLKDVAVLAGKDGKFERRNLDAGRLGRLFTLGFVTYDETGVADPKQTIKVTQKLSEFLRPVKAA